MGNTRHHRWRRKKKQKWWYHPRRRCRRRRRKRKKRVIMSVGYDGRRRGGGGGTRGGRGRRRRQQLQKDATPYQCQGRPMPIVLLLRFFDQTIGAGQTWRKRSSCWPLFRIARLPLSDRGSRPRHLRHGGIPSRMDSPTRHTRAHSFHTPPTTPLFPLLVFHYHFHCLGRHKRVIPRGGEERRRRLLCRRWGRIQERKWTHTVVHHIL